MVSESAKEHETRRRDFFPGPWVVSVVFVSVLSAAVASAVSVSPSRITTGLRWDNVTGGSYNYVGKTLTVSGGSGTITWAILYQNRTVVTTLSSSGGKTAPGIFGEIDCTGSSSNSVCVYNAPAEYPTGETGTLIASSGSSNASVSLTFTFAHNLQEYWKHRSRMLGFKAKPVSNLQACHVSRLFAELAGYL